MRCAPVRVYTAIAYIRIDIFNVTAFPIVFNYNGFI